MKKRFLTVPLNDMGKTEYDCGIELTPREYRKLYKMAERGK